MGYEIDFLAVGSASSSGDAITLRYGNLFGPRSEQTVVVVDGGYAENGPGVVEHIRKYYGTERGDLVISTHPDQDHIGGLASVLEDLRVGQLWIHRPWDHEEEVPGDLFIESSGRVVLQKAFPDRLQYLERSLKEASNLYDLAVAKEIPITEPFEGTTTEDGAITVLGPSERYYGQLVATMERGIDDDSVRLSLVQKARELLREAVSVVAESFDLESLDDSGVVSPENNSSTVLLFKFDGRRSLFTADAGIEALTFAHDYADAQAINLGNCDFIQMPHHGSRRNVGPMILNRMIGPILNSDANLKTSFVSAAVHGAPRHPAKKVTNAFRRRGAYVYSTAGSAIRHSHDAPPRANWSALSALPFYTEVED